MAKKAAKKKSPAKKAATKKAAPKASSSKKVTKKATPKKAAAKKVAAKKTTSVGVTANESTAKKKVPAKTKAAEAEKTASVAKKKTAPKKTVKKVAVAKKIPTIAKPIVNNPTTPANGSKPKTKPKKLPAAFLRKQQQKLLDLRDNLVNQMNGVARDTLRGADGDGSAFGMHQADAGSDAYDRDFALNLLSQEQDALQEIDEALKRIENGTYGYCEQSHEPIPQMRLEAMPFARMTVACQEKQDQQEALGHHRQPVTSLFGLDEKEKTTSDS